jgi:hypothetical protein
VPHVKGRVITIQKNKFSVQTNTIGRDEVKAKVCLPDEETIWIQQLRIKNEEIVSYSQAALYC